MAYEVEKTDEQWRAELSPEEYAVLRKAAALGGPVPLRDLMARARLPRLAKALGAR